ncbi:hypothetical protein PRZ48_000754 [Zasmidium cellare]|uniref:Uncharacterized protein n=1 Tax=Zasmidium cellare TaxID=395010 RepID=A0ABR0EZY7_ZASCE|nr:hypothetical protein PRZ48_000754 [Zasmidium cellare]
MSLRGKVALVTGGGKSLPADSARKLAREGAALALHYNTSKTRDQALLFRDELRRTYAGIRVSMHYGDLSSALAVEQLFNEVVAEYRKIDLVVNTAGVVLSNEKLFTYSVFVDGQKNKWTDRYSEAQMMQASSCERGKVRDAPLKPLSLNTVRHA